MSTLKIIFAGTPEFAVPALRALIDSPHEVVAVYSQPDRLKKKNKIIFREVKQVAVDAGLPVEQPETLKDIEAQQKLAAYNADIMIVAAYGLMLPQEVLDAPRYGCINIHGSLLPRWRGAAPIQRAIQAGDSETGVTIMQMALGLDTGDMLYKTTSCPITKEDTGRTIHDRLANDGANALLTVLDQLIDNKLSPEKQDDSLATYAHKLDKAEAEIDWTKSAQEIDRMIRAFNRKPVAYTHFNGQRLSLFMSKVETDKSSNEPVGTVIDETPEGISIVTGDGVLSVSRLQLSGKNEMSARDFLNGRSLLGSKLPS